MATLLEYVGSVHIYLGPYRGNPIALYLRRTDTGCQIGPRAYPWNDVVGAGETPNKAAADFEEKWKGKGLAADMYSGPSWEGGIKPERPAPPKPAAPPPQVCPPPLQLHLLPRRVLRNQRPRLRLLSPSPPRWPRLLQPKPRLNCSVVESLKPHHARRWLVVCSTAGLVASLLRRMPYVA